MRSHKPAGALSHFWVKGAEGKSFYGGVLGSGAKGRGKGSRTGTLRSLNIRGGGGRGARGDGIKVR